MSSHTMLSAECPSCRATRDIVVWQSIDVTSNPALKEQLFTGAINYFSCPTCNFEGFITAPLAYRDREKQICAHYVPVEYLEDEAYLKQSFTPEGKVRPGEHPETAGQPCQPDTHIVFSMPELIRYVLFRDRLGQVYEGAGQGA